MKKNKGFTLIEIIGTIVIMAAIILIVVPIINLIISKVERETFKSSVIGIIDSADNYVTGSQFKDTTTTFTCNGTNCNNEKEDLSFSGSIPIGGDVLIENEDVSVELITNGKFCASGTKNDLEVANSCLKLDKTGPIVSTDLLSYTSTTNSITLNIGTNYAVDNESGIIKYTVLLIKDGTFLKEKSSTTTDHDISFTFDGLNYNTTYSLEVIAINGNDLKSYEKLDVTTKNMNGATITYTNSPSVMSNGYLISQIANVTYHNENIENPSYYFKTTREGISDVKIVSSCGNNTLPKECKDIDGITTLDANTWYKVDAELKITYSKNTNNNDTIYAVTYDGVNYTSAVTGTLAKIDGINPHVEFNITGTSYSDGYQSGVVIKATCIDNESGVKSGSKTTTLTSAGNNTVTGICVDNAGNNYSYSNTYKIYVYSQSSVCGYRSCQTPSCGVASYNTCTNPACGVASYNSCTNSACGVASYNTCVNSACGVSQYKSCANAACGNKTCENKACGVEQYKSCATAACGYKSCATSACGVASYNSCQVAACGASSRCKTYKSCQNSACGCKSYKSFSSASACNSFCSAACSGNGTGRWTCTNCSAYKTCAAKACGCASYYYATCQNSACGVNSYKTCAAKACGDKKCRDKSCGVASYKTCANAACGYKSCRVAPCGIESYKSCATEACGVASYKTCVNSACGVASYNTCTNPACGVASYNTCTSSSCGANSCWHT